MTDGSSNGHEPTYQLHVGVDDLTLEDVEEIENRTGQAIDNMIEDGTPKARLVRALFFIQMRQEQPDASAEDLWQQTGKIRLTSIKSKGEEVPPIVAGA